MSRPPSAERFSHLMLFASKNDWARYKLGNRRIADNAFIPSGRHAHVDLRHWRSMPSILLVAINLLATNDAYRLGRVLAIISETSKSYSQRQRDQFMNRPLFIHICMSMPINNSNCLTKIRITLWRPALEPIDARFICTVIAAWRSSWVASADSLRRHTNFIMALFYLSSQAAARMRAFSDDWPRWTIRSICISWIKAHRTIYEIEWNRASRPLSVPTKSCWKAFQRPMLMSPCISGASI